MKLLRYEAARQALAEARRVDEVKDIRDKALVLEAYAKQANDRDMLRWVNEIRLRAERRTGELLREIDKQHGARGVGKKVASSANDSTPKLRDLGISRDQSSQWQRLAAIPQSEFDRRLSKESATGLTTQRLLRARESKQTPAAEPWDMGQARDRLQRAIQLELTRWGGEPQDLVYLLRQLTKELQP